MSSNLHINHQFFLNLYQIIKNSTTNQKGELNLQEAATVWSKILHTVFICTSMTNFKPMSFIKRHINQVYSMKKSVKCIHSWEKLLPGCGCPSSRALGEARGSLWASLSSSSPTPGHVGRVVDKWSDPHPTSAFSFTKLVHSLPPSRWNFSGLAWPMWPPDLKSIIMIMSISIRRRKSGAGSGEGCGQPSVELSQNALPGLPQQKNSGLKKMNTGQFF